MTERELEQRLRIHLHARFDGAQPPPELVASIRQAISTPPRRLGLATFRAGAFRPGWLAIAAVVVVAVVTVAGFELGIVGPGANPTPTLAPTPTTRHFIVLPSSLTVPDKDQTDLASTILAKRLEALGFGTFTSSAGIEIKFELPRTGPTDEVVENVLRAGGDVAFVPLPRERYGDQNGGEGINLPIGQELPTDEPALFGWDGIASVTPGEARSQPIPILTFSLKPAAMQAFGEYTASHQGELFAVLIDGEVVAVPAINEPMTTGTFSLTGGRQSEADWLATMAILAAGGPLPHDWARPIVPHVRPVEDFVPQVQFENPGATLVSAELGVYESNIGFPWVAVWRTTFAGDFPQCRDVDPVPVFCTADRNLLVTLDVESGNSYP
jgi:hypothetical protein